MGFPWVKFQDGIVYHDYHFNGMQMQIARAQKTQDVESRYEARLLVHDRASYLWFDPLVDTGNIQSITGALLDEQDLTLRLAAASASITWKAVPLPEPAAGAELTWLADVPAGSQLRFELSFDGGLTWQEAAKAAWVDGVQTQSILVRCSAVQAPSGSRPTLIDIALFW